MRIALFATLAVLLPVSAAQLPNLKGTTLDGHQVTIPNAPNVAAYVLSFGFSRKSDKPMAAWDKLIAPLYAGKPGVAYYEIPVLQGVPGMVKPMILHGMRKTIAGAEQSRFAPIYDSEAPLKQLAGFQEPDAAYVVVANSAGQVLFTTHAPASPTALGELRKTVDKLVP